MLTRCRFLLLIPALVSFCCFGATSDSWHGLTLIRSAPDDAIRILGKPEQDLSGEFKSLVYKFHINDSPSLTKACKTEVVRLLKFDNVADFKSVYLFFKNDKLVLIRLHLDKNNKITPSELRDTYEGVRFRTVLENEDWWSTSFGVSQATGEVRPKNYPTIYYQIGITDASIVYALVGNTGWGELLGGMTGSASADLPGKIDVIALISAQLAPVRQPKKALQ
jgi:hypothetical protein